MTSSDIRGRFVWYDLMTTDLKAALRFYANVTGWGVEDWKNSETPYKLWMAAETAVGGAMELPADARAMGASPQWMAHVGTPDVDATCREVEALGGNVLKQPEDIPTVGRFAVIADPQGATLSVFSSVEGGEMPSPKWGTPGTFSWNELMTSDPIAALEFYRALFGWEPDDAVDMGEDGLYQMFTVGGRMLGGMYKKPAQVPGPPRWLYYVLVEDIERALAVVRQGGGQVLNGPMEVPGGDLIAQCLDPQGVAFAIHAKKQ